LNRTNASKQQQQQPAKTPTFIATTTNSIVDATKKNSQDP